MNAKNMSRLTTAGIGIALVTTMSFNSAFALHAHDGTTLVVANEGDVKLSLQAGTMYVDGQQDEYVYLGKNDYGAPSDYKMSELNWDISSLFMIGGEASLQLGQLIRFNAAMWVGVTDGDGGMDDYDWLDPDRSEWTEHSESDVDIESAYSIDINASMQFADLGVCKLHGMLGYKEDYWEWSDHGGKYTYSSGGGFRNDIGDFGGVNGIDYEQTFDIYYAGIKATMELDKLHGSAYFLYSPFVSAEDKDHHIMRDLYFEEDFDGGDYYAFGLEATLDITDALFITCALDFQEIPEFTGDMKSWEAGSDVVTKSSDSAGIGSSLMGLSASVGIKF